MIGPPASPPNTGPPSSSAVEAILRRDRWIVVAGLVVITLLSWVYLLGVAAAMGEMTGATMTGEVADDLEAHLSMGMRLGAAMGPQLWTWTPRDFGFTFLMWAVMMVAMMVPSASPMILLHARVCRQNDPRGALGLASGVFVLGYLSVWTGFSLGATLLQWGLERLALLSPMMMSTSATFAAAVVLAAGVYQLTPVKEACLVHCRSPLHFVTHLWRSGVRGAFRMGIRHGMFCLGCCWVLMGLLFVGGIMNVAWIGALTVLVLLEKVLRRGELVARLSGVILVVAGLIMLVRRIQA